MVYTTFNLMFNIVNGVLCAVAVTLSRDKKLRLLYDDMEKKILISGISCIELVWVVKVYTQIEYVKEVIEKF